MLYPGSHYRRVDATNTVAAALVLTRERHMGLVAVIIPRLVDGVVGGASVMVHPSVPLRLDARRLTVAQVCVVLDPSGGARVLEVLKVFVPETSTPTSVPVLT